MKNRTVKNLFEFYINAEKLKTTMRHSWTSDSNRQESTAEHSYMLCLIAMTLFDEIEINVDQLKILKMIAVHDLAEAITGDIPAFDTDRRKNKKENESQAIKKLTKNLDEKTRIEFQSLIDEYDKKETFEAKVVQAIDKFEAPFQHNISDIKTWDQNDFNIHGKYKQNYLNFDPFLKALREELENMSRKKLTKANQLHRLPKEIQKYYKKLNEEEKV